MRKARLTLLSLGMLCALPAHLCAQSESHQPPDLLEWRSGLSEISEGWAAHEGDNLTWVLPEFNDTGWNRVDVEDLGAATAGWRWFRKRVVLSPDRTHVSLLIQGGDGTYELYINGERAEGGQLRPALDVRRPTERVFALPDGASSYVFALRTRAPVPYAGLHLPLFLSMTMGGPTAIEYERQALESQRLYSVVTSGVINLILCLAAIGAFGLFAYQRKHREYLFLGLFLLLTGLSDGLVTWQEAGVLPISIGALFADPLTYLFSIAQIEFTFAFAGQRVGVGWRIYEALLLCPLLLVPLAWNGYVSFAAYELVEASVAVPVAVALPLVLFAWWRRGNREAALLILPSMLPAATGILVTMGSAAIYLHWKSLEFLADDPQIGPVTIRLFDIGAFLFLLAIGVVMVFRFTRVSREQARAAAELDAAREIQRQLVPACLPSLESWQIEAAYLPANEVGGDFYQVLGENGGLTWIVVGDVSGKGLKAAMTGALTIGALRTLASEGLGPAALLTRLNVELVRAQTSGFVTCFCAAMAPDCTLRFANAGHLAPYCNGKEIATPGALPLGLAANTTYEEHTLEIEPGDRLTLLSDGVVEAQSAGGELFGFDRVQEISTENAEAIARAAQLFGQTDDITVLTLTRRGTPRVFEASFRAQETGSKL